MGYRTFRRPPPLTVATISDSSLLGKVEGTLAVGVVPYALRTIEALRADPARAALNSPDAPWYEFVGGGAGATGSVTDNALFQESFAAKSNSMSGRTAEDFINATNGASTLTTIYAAIRPTTHLIIELGGNDIGTLGRTPAQVITSISTLVALSKSLRPTTKVIVVPCHSVPGGTIIAQLQALMLVASNTGADFVVGGVANYTTAMMVDPGGGDGHPKIPTSPDLIATWRGTLDPTNYGIHAMGMWIWDVLYAGHKRPLKVGESWAP